jgi:hypothetical protein
MNPSELSVFIFGIYLIIVAAGFLFIPNIILPIFKLPKTEEQWIRVLAIVLVAVASYYIVAAMNGLTIILWTTVYVRFGVAVSFIGLVLAKKAKPPLIIFGIIDTMGALWTMFTLT